MAKKKNKGKPQSKILVVEDDLTLLEALEYNLAGDGYEVITAADGLTALEVAREEEPDLIVLDLMLPHLDGFEACHILRRETNVPIPQGNDEVDALYNQVYRELISHILEDRHVIEQANQLMWAAHNLERTADRVTNLCERVIYAVTGELTELDTDETRIESLG
jgi:DNA-binding NtrC family response regulator